MPTVTSLESQFSFFAFGAFFAACLFVYCGEEIYMPFMFLAAAAESAESSAEEIIRGPVDALGYSGLGVLIVFAVLLVLMVFITVMSKLVGLGGKKAPAAPAAAPAKAPAAPASPAAKQPAEKAEDGAMYVTLGGKRHAVTVEEKLPRFSVTVNGKTHAVDVEECEKEEAEQ